MVDTTALAPHCFDRRFPHTVKSVPAEHEPKLLEQTPDVVVKPASIGP